ncbi:MAG: hypothetical protein JF886_02250 [Candidatus Dormibacteraeota bacterium]|uniref:Trehalose synthase N-terminal domain-containing protein n=1 Tax=Candidatus Aeolococcus gillhamiae TaxID=3127015 RepID=A0A2W5Z7K0_9BACT|nr:hypothetical protein [Candidatus Dormibacteraeota bacterium]PZR78835.1 MAG: hypothetical protein DLM65_11955 [Candidatus Dormibacter sp. RRmetagenome_bin12]
MPDISEVEVGAVDPERFETVLSKEQVADLDSAIADARQLFEGRTIWNVNSTAHGGGVAEMLTALLPYARGVGVDTRWLVIAGDENFFVVTKRIHNRLHGAPGDGQGLSDDDRRHYEEVLKDQAEQLIQRFKQGDVIILHDPQTAGLIPPLVDAGFCVVWRCHVGMDTPNDDARDTWNFLLPYVHRAARCIFSREAFAWEGLEKDRIIVVAPSIDPFSTKNFEMDPASVHAILTATGIVDDSDGSAATYQRVDGSPGRIEHTATIVEASRLGSETPLVLQVSRWDRLKDPIGVLEGFVGGVIATCDAHLLLAGPSVAEVADDPEGAET